MNKCYFFIHLSNRDEEKSFLFTLANSLILKKVRNELGLSSCEKFFSGAAPIGSDTIEFFLGLNITLYEAYGLSETSGPHFMSGPKTYKRTRQVLLILVLDFNVDVFFNAIVYLAVVVRWFLAADINW